MYHRTLLYACTLVLLAGGLTACAGTLDTLRPDHPRLMASDADFERIARLIKEDGLARGWYAELKQRGEDMLDEPVTKYNLRDGRRLLYESREVLGRVVTLAMLDRLSPDDRYRDRIWADLESAARFKHWNPDHFLDVAEMGFAFALAYDWMHDRWTEAQRETIRTALIDKAIRPGLLAYEQNAWWTRTQINWSQVCNGGLIAASLAVADEEPELAERLINQAVPALKFAMQRYAPDGGYREGPGYWSYGTIYNIYAMALLESALGTDLGLGAMPGFDRTGSFPIQMTGPTGLTYNFADGSAKPPRSPGLFYLAKRYDQPAYARFAAEHNTGSVFDLLWYDPKLASADAAAFPLSADYESAGVASFRSAWDDPDAWFVAAKGGWIGDGHSQLDLGSFIFEQQGVRWLIDLGADNYNLPGYFAAQATGRRWDFYRNRAEGHNTLVVNPDAGLDQPYAADATIKADGMSIRIDLSKVYGGDAQRVIRLDDDALTITDTLAFDKPSSVWWFAHTTARIDVSDAGRSALLTREGKAMRARIVSPTDARFDVMAARPLPTSPDPAGQNPNNGAELLNTPPGSHFTRRGEAPQFGEPDPDNTVRKLAIKIDDATQLKIEVVFEPVEADE